jgi:hypothetical protein
VDADHDNQYDCRDACVDLDRDGYGSGSGCSGADCDDTSYFCTTSCTDLDNNGVPDCRQGLLCADADGDGYGTGTACRGADCDDTVITCNTGCVADNNNNGVRDWDEDCIDADRDGYGIGAQCLGSDCNPTERFCWSGCVDLDLDGMCVESGDEELVLNVVAGKPLLVHTGDVCYPSGSPNCYDWDEAVDGQWGTTWYVQTNPTTVLVADLGTNHTLIAFRYLVSWDGRETYGTGAQLTISVSTDNAAWEPVDERTVTRLQMVDFQVSTPVTARYVRFAWTGSQGAAWNGWGHVYEFQAFGY